MKLRISITILSVAALVSTGCSTMKTAYNGNEHSHFVNPAKTIAMNNQQQAAQSGLLPVAEGPEDMPAVHAANPGGTGSGAMTGMSAPDAWGGGLSTR